MRHAPLDFLGMGCVRLSARGRDYRGGRNRLQDGTRGDGPPFPDFFRSPIWGFAPVFLMISATVILFLREFVFPRAVSSHVVATRDHALHGRIDLPVTESYYIGDAIIANQMPALPRLIGTVTRNETRLRIILCNLDWRGRLVQTSATAT